MPCELGRVIRLWGARAWPDPRQDGPASQKGKNRNPPTAEHAAPFFSQAQSGRQAASSETTNISLPRSESRSSRLRGPVKWENNFLKPVSVLHFCLGSSSTFRLWRLGGEYTQTKKQKDMPPEPLHSVSATSDVSSFHAESPFPSIRSL